MIAVRERLVVRRVQSDDTCNEVGFRRVGLQSLVAKRPVGRRCGNVLFVEALAFFEVFVLSVVVVESTVGEGVTRRSGSEVDVLAGRGRARVVVYGLRNACAVDICNEHRAARKSA